MVISPNTKATVFDIQKFSIHDGPGIRTIVFLKGCPLRCQWCANPESNVNEPELMYFPEKCINCRLCIVKCTAGAIKEINGTIQFLRSRCDNCLNCVEVCSSQARKISGKTVSVENIYNEIMKDRVFYESSGGGITFSGGEPFLWPDFVLALGKSVKERGINTAIETCGDYPESYFEVAKDGIDLILFDIKMISEKKHIHFCGSSNKRILSNLKKAFCSEIPTVIRTPIIPDINDSLDDIASIIDFLAPYKDCVKAINLLPYHNLGMNKYDALSRPYLLKDTIAPSMEQMEKIKLLFEKENYDTKIGG